MDKVPNGKNPGLAKSGQQLTLALVILLIFAVGGAGVFAYLWQEEVSDSIVQRQSSDSAQSEVASLKDQLLKSQKNSTVEQSASSNDPVKATESDEDMIIAMVGAYAHLDKGSEGTKLDIRVSKKLLPFARVSIMTDGGGYACVLKKSDNLWVVLFCGQGSPMQDQLDAWGVPNSMLSS